MSTDRARWLRLSQLFDHAIDLHGEARAAFVLHQCGNDIALRDELQRMLDADETTHGLDAGAAVAVASNLHDADEEARRAVGECVGAWRLQALLGRGGMGSVYAARREDGDTEQQAAVKRLQRRWDGSAQAQRFLQERRILALLSHANIPALIDHGLDDEGRPWFALEFVDGQPLTDWAGLRALSLRGRIVLFLQVCAAVQHAHERFVVHRDLKPGNILVDADGRARVLDFGVAKRLDDGDSATRTGVFAGFTPEYAAPEQVSGGVITAGTDVYALGVLLYQLLSGVLPYQFAHTDLRDAAEAITNRAPGRLDRALAQGAPDDVQERMRQRATTPAAYRLFVRGDVTRIVQTALAKEPERRYASVQALSGDLRRFLDGRPVSVSGDTTAYRARKFVQRNRWGVAMAAVAVLALAGGMAGMALKTRQAQDAALQAERQAALARQQEARARSEAGRAQASRDFLTSLLGQASPERNAGQDPTVRQVLDRASTRIERELAGQPELEVETMNLVAQAYSDLSLYDKARPLFERAVDVASRTPDISASVRAGAHAGYAYTLLAQSNLDDARREVDHAVALLNPLPPGLPMVKALGTQATILYLQEQYLPALTAQRKATQIAAATAGKRSRAYAEALIELSYFLEGAGQGAQAVSVARQAHDMLQVLLPDSGDPVVTRALWAYGNALTAAGNDADAIAPLTRARDLVAELYGAESLKSMRALQLLGSAELGAGRIAQAQTSLSAALRLAAKLAPQHPLVTMLQLHLSEARLRGGDPAGALRELATLQASLARSQANAPERARHARLLQARALDALQHHDQAQALLGELAEAARARRDPIPPALSIAMADNARLRSDLPVAHAHLARARSDLGAGTGAAARAALALAEARLAAREGNAASRRRAAAVACDLLERQKMTAAPEYAQARALR